MNVLKNGSFESLNWHNDPVGSTVNQQPEYWALTYVPVGTKLRSAGYFPAGSDDNPVFETALTIPECVHKLHYQLPVEQQFGGSDALILEGAIVYKVFSSVNPFGVQLEQTIPNPGVGTLKLDIPVRVHQHGDGSPGAAAWRVLVGGYTSPWFSFGTGFTDRVWKHLVIDLLHTGGDLSFKLQLESRALGGIDFFVDNLVVDFVPTATEPETVDYVVVTNLLPQDTTEDELAEAMRRTYAQKRSIVYSADDAARLVAPGLPGSHVVSWNPERWTQGDIVQWLKDKGVNDVRKTWFIEQPEPPVGGNEPTPYPVRSKNFVGLHSGFVRSQTWRYLQESGTNIQKFFSAGDAYQAGLLAPACTSIWRKYVGNEEGRIDEKPTIRESAIWYLDQYTAELNSASAALGITVEQLLSGIDAIESLNETIGTFSANLPRAIEFDAWFAEETYKRFGNLLLTVLCNGAVGNPHETEVVKLLPAVEAVCKYGGFLGYHPYWAANEFESFQIKHWHYHAGRWQEWDKEFVKRGLYPRYALGEGGICYAPDGQAFNAGLGWKSCGSFERYLPDIVEMNRRIAEWNALHANRCAGVTLFGYGNWGWENFELGDGEVILLNDWARNPSGTLLASTLGATRIAFWDLQDSSDYVRDLQDYLDTADYVPDDNRAHMENELWKRSL